MIRKIILKNEDIREFCVQVDSPSPIQQAQVPIPVVITLIQGVLTPIRPVVPLIVHICSYPPYDPHLHPWSLSFVHLSIIIAEHKVTSSLSISPWHDQQLTLSIAYNKYSIHQVQHAPSTASIEYIIAPRYSIFPSFSRLRIDP